MLESIYDIQKQHTQLHPWQKRVLVLWCVVLGALFVRTALTPQKQNVFHIFTLAGHHWLEGASLYGDVAEDRDVYRYSPLAAASFAPWSFFPLRITNGLWRILNAILFFCGVSYWLTRVSGYDWSSKRLAVFWLLLLPMSIPSLNNGQINPMLIGLILGGVAAVQEKKWWLASLLLAIAFWLKLYPIAIVCVLGLLFFRNMVVTPALAIFALGCLPFLLQAPSYVANQYQDWVGYLRVDDRTTMPLDYWLRDIRLLFRVWFLPLTQNGFIGLQIIVAFMVASLCWGAKARGHTEQKQLLFATQFCCIWMTLFGPSTESCTWIILAPVLVLALIDAWSSKKNHWQTGLVSISYVLFVSVHLAKWFPFGNSYANLAVQPIAALLLSVTLVNSYIWDEPALSESMTDDSPEPSVMAA